MVKVNWDAAPEWADDVRDAKGVFGLTLIYTNDDKRYCDFIEPEYDCGTKDFNNLIHSSEIIAKRPSELLKPCPFCGKKVAKYIRKNNPYARCETKNCKGSQLPVINLDEQNDIDKWNTRAPLSRINPNEPN